MSMPVEKIEQIDVPFEDRLHCLLRFDPSPPGYPRNDSNPFAPYFYCPYDMRIDIVYRDAVMLLENLASKEVAETRKAIKDTLISAKRKYIEHIKHALPGRPKSEYTVAAKYMYDMRKTELLSMFSPAEITLSTGQRIGEHHLWAVYAIEEIVKALKLLNLPMSPRTKRGLSASPYIGDMLDAKLNLTENQLMGDSLHWPNAAHRMRSYMISAANHVTYANQHIQRAIFILLSKSSIERDKVDRLIKARRMSGLLEINTSKSTTISRASEIAKSLWAEDTAQSIRLGEMADRVYRALVSEGLERQLPETADSVKPWIKSVAPEYARKGGRPRKPS